MAQKIESRVVDSNDFSFPPNIWVLHYSILLAGAALTTAVALWVCQTTNTFPVSSGCVRRYSGRVRYFALDRDWGESVPSWPTGDGGAAQLSRPLPPAGDGQHHT